MAQKHVKPNLSVSQLEDVVKRLFRLTASEIRSLPSYDDQNLYVAGAEGGEYVLKIMNSEDSKNQTLVEVQTTAMSLLHQNGLPAQTALPTTSGQLMSLEEIGMWPSVWLEKIGADVKQFFKLGIRTNESVLTDITK